VLGAGSPTVQIGYHDWNLGCEAVVLPTAGLPKTSKRQRKLIFA